MSEHGKLVLLKLEGNLEQQGFQATLEISEEGERPYVEKTGFLPPAPKLIDCLNQWQEEYHLLAHNGRIRPVGIIYGRPESPKSGCQKVAQELSDLMNCWLESESFRVLDRELREQLDLYEPIRFLIRTNDPYLRRLPWDLWNFIKKYTLSEIALAPTNCEQTRKKDSKPLKTPKKVRILAILGDSTGIDTEADRLILEALPNAEVEFLVEPKRYEISDHLWGQPWDILFFAGHSETQQEKGLIHINSAETLTLEELTYSLKSAIENGLQLAIFNSCDGLGLLQALEGLNLPPMILMREPIADRMAQQFLKYFLQGFAGGMPLYLAHRQAREKLQGWEHLFPCASWLPVICQNPATIPGDWSSLEGKLKNDESSPPNWQVTGLIALGVTMVLISLRSLGALQGWELKAFDQLVRSRPAEPVDERIVVVTIDEEDIQYQEQQKMERRGSLADVALAQLLNKLTPYHPRVTASDIVHDFPFATTAAVALKKVPSFVGICRLENAQNQSKLASIPPPPTLDKTQLGFSNLVLDPDEVIRRQILGMSRNDDDPCTTTQAFSFRIFREYLPNLPLEKTEQGIKIGNLTLSEPDQEAGGYHLSDREVAGYQILVNYRATPPTTIPLREILNGSLDQQLSQLISDKIILIGVDIDNMDEHFTPYSQKEKLHQSPGVLIHAQMISQLISAVEEQRPLFWWWPEGIERVWIGFWALLGGMAFWLGRDLLQRSLLLILAGGMLSGVCFLVLLQGGWIPLVPALLALVLTGFFSDLFYQWQSRRH